MGQHEIYELLKNKRLSGDDAFYSVSQIRKFILDNADDTNSVENVSRVVNRLHYWSILDRRTFEGVYKYRVKKNIFENSVL